MAPTDVAGSRPDGMYALSTGFVGTEAAIAFSEFVAKYARVISAEDVLEGKIDAEQVKDLQASESLAVLDKLVVHCADNDWKKKEARNIAAFVKLRGGEQMVYFWNAISKVQKLNNIQAIHKEIGQAVVKIVREARGLSNNS
jgi:hypothetical protein